MRRFDFSYPAIVLAAVFSLILFKANAEEANAVFEAKNLHAATFELPAATARYLNELADKAAGVSHGEHAHFPEEDKTYLMLAVPAAPLPKESFLKEYAKLEVLIDNKQRIRLADHPRLFSRTPSKPDEIRGVPTIVPLEVLGNNFFGEAHDFELMRDGKSIFGPVRWLVTDDRTGPTVTSVQGGPGKGEVTFDLEKIDFRLMTAVVYMDAAFGEPLAITQVLPDGSEAQLKARTVGLDMVGDRRIFQELYIEGFTVGFARTLKLRVRFNHSGKGYFSLVGQANTKLDANKLIDVP